MSESAFRMVIDDPSKFSLLTTDMKEQMIKGLTATVNVQAALARKYAIKNIQDDFTLRNSFTTRQIQYTPMPQGRYSINAIKSSIGVTEKAGYMALQEKGGLRVPAQGDRLAVPTNLARGGNKGSPVARKDQVGNLKNKMVYVHFKHSGAPKSELVKSAYIAAKHKSVMRYYKGLFLVSDFIRKSDKGISFKMDMLYEFMNREVFTPENEWLWPASERPAKDTLNIFMSQMKKLGM
jgi:hypothetical protein